MSGRTDYSKIRERFLKRQKALEEMDGWWKPEVGRHRVRILPPAGNHDSWYVEYGVHYNIGEEGNQQSITCPKITMNKPCPICEFVRGLWRGGDADKALARKINGKRRYCSNVILLSKSEDEVRTWAYGPQVWDQLAELCVGDEGGVVPIDDPKEGFNLTIVVSTKSTPDGNFPQYMVKPEMKATPVANQGLLKKMADIKAGIQSKVKTYDEIRAILLGTNEEADTPVVDDTTEVVEPVDTPPETTEEVVETEENTSGTKKSSAEDLVARARAALSKRSGS